MAARRGKDVVGFRRIFVLFCTLVILPSMAASSFGIIAIRNEAAAEKQRTREAAEAALLEAERVLRAELNQIGDRLTDTAGSPAETLRQLRAQGAPIGALLLPPEAREPTGLGPLENEILSRADTLLGDATAPAVAHFLAQDGLTWVAVYKTRPEELAAFTLDITAWAQVLRNGTTWNEDIHIGLALRTGADDAMVGMVQELMAQLVSPTDEAGREVVAQARLNAPFDRMTLTARAAPPKGALKWTYIMLLLAFYTALITGWCSPRASSGAKPSCPGSKPTSCRTYRTNSERL